MVFMEAGFDYQTIVFLGGWVRLLQLESWQRSPGNLASFTQVADVSGGWNRLLRQQWLTWETHSRFSGGFRYCSWNLGFVRLALASHGQASWEAEFGFSESVCVERLDSHEVTVREGFLSTLTRKLNSWKANKGNRSENRLFRDNFHHIHLSSYYQLLTT